MARYRRGRMALYEVMSKGRFKSGPGRTLEKIQTGEPPKDQPGGEHPTEPLAEAAAPAGQLPEAAGTGERPVRWRKKPPIVQVNTGRIEFSLPYQLAIAVVLGLVAVVLFAFQAGGRYYAAGQAPGTPPAKTPRAPDQPSGTPRQRTPPEATPPRKPPASSETAGAATKSTGNNVIVLVQYPAKRDLQPVQAHFAAYGIATEIIASAKGYLLVTKDTYDNPEKPGTDGYAAKQRIAQVGAMYKGKAPEGYETFAPHYFGDAYGMKVQR